jgi:hypothetical protein
MTELEFINANPGVSGSNGVLVDNINVFYSSSLRRFPNPITGDLELTSIPDLSHQVSITGMSIPFKYLQGNVDIQQTILQAENITFRYSGAGDVSGSVFLTATILERVRRATYFFIRLRPIVLNPSNYTRGQIQLGNRSQFVPSPNADPQFNTVNYFQIPSEIIFNPYISTVFNNSPDNPLLSNATVLRKANYVQQVDRNEDPIQPTNLAQILLNQASAAEIQDSNYTSAGIINARYVGSKLTSGSVPGNDPALALVGIRASLHPSGSNFTKIRAINVSDREVQQVYFTPQVTNNIAGGKTRTYGGNKSFPTGSNLLYVEEGNRFVRISNRDIYSIDEDKMHSTNNLGTIIRTQ